MKYREKVDESGQRWLFSPHTSKWCKVFDKQVPEGEKLTARARRRAANPRIMVLLKSAAAAAKATRSPRMFVWLWLQYEAWRTGSATVTATNSELEFYGINRERKRQALLDLEASGLIRVERSGLEAVTVTIIDPDYLHIYKFRVTRS
jgi:hypothetical protein